MRWHAPLKLFLRKLRSCPHSAITWCARRETCSKWRLKATLPTWKGRASGCHQWNLGRT